MTAFGAFNFTIGITALPASLIMGTLWTAYGHAVAFMVSGGFAILAAALLAALVPERQDAVQAG